MSLAYSPSKPLPLSQVAAWDIDTDVAIVGFGIAGACAAIEARQAGAAVTVFEVAAAAGGNDDGSGIRMGLSVGGAAIHMEQFFATRPFYPPGDLVKGDADGIVVVHPNWWGQPPAILKGWVDRVLVVIADLS